MLLIDATDRPSFILSGKSLTRKEAVDYVALTTRTTHVLASGAVTTT